MNVKLKHFSPKIGIVGGSGLYHLEGMELLKKINLKTPYGRPSSPIHVMKVEDIPIAFLSRHAEGHTLPPSQIPYQANIYALKCLGVNKVISISAVGSLRDEMRPEDFVLPDQLIDRTKHRPSTFAEKGFVHHMAFADPFCDALRNAIYQVTVPPIKQANKQLFTKATYLCMEGPAFSTRAESHLYRDWKADVIGMTALPEAKLAREAEMCYATIGMITDYDCWRMNNETVNLETVITHMTHNTNHVKKMIADVVRAVHSIPSCEHHSCMKNAIVTDKKRIPSRLKKKLKPLYGEYLR